MERNERIKKPVKQLNRKTPAPKRPIMRDLKEKGFRRAKPYPGLFINEYGNVYSLNAGKELKTDCRNLVFAGDKRVNVPKLVLLVFRNEPIREKSHIRHLDGNRRNLSPSNIEYVRKYESGLKNEVNPENLYTAVRCYIEAPKRYNIKDCVLTRFYLTEIIQKRHFYEENYKRPGLDIFKSYMKGFTNNVKAVGKEHNVNFRDVQIIVNDYLNLLSNDILADLEAGKLNIRDFQPRPKTKTQVLREANEHFVKKGLKPVPLRKKSIKEILRDFRKSLNETDTEEKE